MANLCGIATGAALVLPAVGGLLAFVGLLATLRRMDRRLPEVEAAVALARAARQTGRRLWQRSAAWLRRTSRRLIGRPGPRVFRESLSATARMSSRATATVRSRPKRRLDRQVEQLREEVRALERHVADEVAAERVARQEGDAEARQFAGDLLARALHLEVYAAAAILLGAVAAILGPRVC